MVVPHPAVRTILRVLNSRSSDWVRQLKLDRAAGTDWVAPYLHGYGDFASRLSVCSLPLCHLLRDVSAPIGSSSTAVSKEVNVGSSSVGLRRSSLDGPGLTGIAVSPPSTSLSGSWCGGSVGQQNLVGQQNHLGLTLPDLGSKSQ